MGLRIGVREADVREPGGTCQLGGPCEHGGRDVDAVDAAARPDTRRERARGRTAAAADVEDALAGCEARAVHYPRAELLELRVEHRLVLDPLGRGGLVPIADLLGVGAGRVERRHMMA